LRNAPGLSWIVDENGDLLFASEAFYRYFGLNKNTSVGQKLVELVPASVSSKFYTKHLKVFETGKSLQTTRQLQFADGTRYTAYVNLFPIQSADGKRLVAGLTMHLPRDNKMVSRLREAKEKLLMISHATSDAIWEWDMQSGHIYRNEPLMKLIGYEDGHFTGLTWWLRHIHPADRERIRLRVKKAAETHEASWQEQYRFKCADGTYMHVKDRGYVIYEHGIAVRMIGSITDMTNVKQLEAELMDEKLKRQTEIAETVMRVQEMERTRLGHELHDNVNQILSSAKLYIELVKTPHAKEQEFKKKGMEYIVLAIEEIRKLSRELVVPQVKQKGLADSIRMLMEDMHVTSAIKFSFIHDPVSDFESMHSAKKLTLYRIIQEQVKNILKHSKATLAGICLRVAEGDLKLMIWDNGIGFTPRKTATGIGLSNMRERVSFYNGTLDIQSAPGEGSKVIVTIPAA
jgi:PAS domain S-box-containing protein